VGLQTKTKFTLAKIWGFRTIKSTYVTSFAWKILYIQSQIIYNGTITLVFAKCREACLLIKILYSFLSKLFVGLNEFSSYVNDIYTHTHTHTVGSCFATVHFTTIHFYNPCQVRLSTPDLWCLSVTTQASFLNLLHLQLFSGVLVFLLFLF